MALRNELVRQGNYLFKNRSYQPLLALLIGLLGKIYQERYNGDGSESILAEILEASAIWVGIAGIIIRAMTVGYTPESTSGRNTNAGQVAETLNTSGLYSLTRNPLYLGNFLMWISVVMLTGNFWLVLLFTLTFWIYYERIIFAEEDFLTKKFGRRYLEWAERTPPFFPHRLGYEHPSLPFSWKKVLKKEKNGFFALFLAHCIFALAGDLAEGEFSLVEETWSILAATIAGAFYVVLRFLKKHTELLNEVGR